MATRGRSDYRFSGHQTFVFRYGWLEKGVRGVSERPDLFVREDALVLLGVGKNMVESIRHWCQLAQLIERSSDADKNSVRGYQPTEIARKLLVNGGWDPFLEDDASLWLIHWLITTNTAMRTAWHLLFSRFNRLDFTRSEITGYMRDFAAKEGLRVSDSVLARDVDCLLRTYVPGIGQKARAVVEESFACPLIQLSLIQPSPDGELYRFAIGPKPSLPSAVFTYALDEHFRRRDNRTQTMSIQECLYGEGSPGQVFKLDENSLIDYVERLEDSLDGSILLDETAGLKQIYRRHGLDAFDVLASYYKGGSRA